MSTASIASSTTPEDATSPTRRVTNAYLPGLDGVRALAVVAVCLFHFVVPHTQGGFLGVDVFFVVSGYLITSQLWTRWGDSPIRMWPFWEGRIRRLFPAVIVVSLVSLVAMLIAGRDQMRGFLGDLLAAATYTSNWWYIHKDAAYAVEWGMQRPPVLQHLWSLAVEEQFYLLWPLVIAAGIVLQRRHPQTRQRLAIVALVLAVASMVAMGLGSTAADLPRVVDGATKTADRFYYGTDTHSMGLLLGAVLALMRGGRGFGQMKSGRRLRPLDPATPGLTAVGFASLAALIAAFALVDYNQVWMYRVGFSLIALLALLLVAVATRPGPLASLLSLSPLRWVGQRSYSIYLWHWPIVCFTRPQADFGLGEGATGFWVSLVVRTVLTLILAELSYRCIEQPVRHHGWRAAIGWLRGRRLLAPLAAVIALSLGGSIAWAATHKDVTVEQQLHQEIKDSDFSTEVTVAPTKAPTPSSPASASGRPSASATATPTPTKPPRAVNTKTMSVAYYGDSFAVGAAPGIEKVFGTVDLHAAVSRQSAAVFKEMMANKAQRHDVVILHTGNNGTVSESGLRQVLTAYATQPMVIVVLPHTPRSWTPEARAVITKLCGTPGAPKLANVRVADWYSMANGHEDELLVHDHVHPNSKGIAAYTKLIQQVVAAG